MGRKKRSKRGGERRVVHLFYTMQSLSLSNSTCDWLEKSLGDKIRKEKRGKQREREGGKRKR